MFMSRWLLLLLLAENKSHANRPAQHLPKINSADEESQTSQCLLICGVCGTRVEGVQMSLCLHVPVIQLMLYVPWAVRAFLSASPGDRVPRPPRPNTLISCTNVSMSDITGKVQYTDSAKRKMLANIRYINVNKNTFYIFFIRNKTNLIHIYVFVYKQTLDKLD